MTAAGPPDLSYERAEVLARIAGSAMNQEPHLEAKSPIRPLPPELEAKLSNRAEGAAAPPATDLRRRVVGPSAALAVLDAVALVVALVTGHAVLAVLAAVLLVPLAALAILGARYGGGTRLTLADRQRIAAASRWRSRQSWGGPIAYGSERGLVIAAADVAGRIAGSPAWRSGRLDEQRVRLDLGLELDQIDEQAHRIATARAQSGAVTADPAVDAAWNAAVDRVAALTAYANELDGAAQRRRDELARLGDPVRDGRLLAGATQDDIAFQQLFALTLFLNAQSDGQP